MKLSVALCTHNGQAHIGQQLLSILEQTVPVDEIILSDDNSTDNTLQIAGEILRQGHVPYRIVQNVPAKGVSKNFLDTMKLTTGDYCFTCDQDDIWLPDKVALFLACAQQSKKDLYFSDGILVDAAAQPLDCSLWEAHGLRPEHLSEDALVHTLIQRPAVTGAAMMVSRRLIQQTAVVPDGIFHDEWFGMLAAVGHSAQAVGEKTFLYRQHSSNTVGAKQRHFVEKARAWRKNFSNLPQLRRLHLSRAQALALAAEGTAYAGLVAPSLAFWETQCALAGLGKWLQLKTVIKLFVSGQYARYYTGLRGLVRDILSLL